MRDVIAEQKALALEKFIPIMDDEGSALLVETVRNEQPEKILEIGTAIGYSGTLMLTASPKATLVTVDIDEERLSYAEEFFEAAGLSKRVRIIKEDACYLLTLLEEKFDFVLLDGPKAHYSSMLDYLLKLTTEDATIFVDDVGYLGLVDNGDYPKHKHRTIVTNMRKFIERVESDATLVSERYGQGVMIIKKCKNPNC